MNIDYDARWKEIIQAEFPDFVAFFMPQLYTQIDFTEKPKFLEQELLKIKSELDKKGKRYVDKLIQIKLNNGEERIILLHIEIQGYEERGEDFPKRMFIYFYRIFDKYEEPVTSLAIYTGDKKPQKPGQYKYEFEGTSNLHRFNTYVVRDKTEAELLEDKNPFALAVLATKYLSLCKNDVERRYQFKRKLIALARERNYSKEKTFSLLNFIELLLVLPAEMEEELKLETYITMTEETDIDTLLNIKSKMGGFAQMVYEHCLKEEIETKLQAYQTKLKKLKKAEEKAEEKIQRAEEKAKEKVQRAEEKAKEKVQRAEEKAEEKVQRAEEKVLAEKILTIQNLLNTNKLSEEEIASLYNLEVDFIKSLRMPKK